MISANKPLDQIAEGDEDEEEHSDGNDVKIASNKKADSSNNNLKVKSALKLSQDNKNTSLNNS